MEFLLVFGSMISPVLLLFLRKKWPVSRLFLNGLAVLSALVFGNMLPHEIIEDKTVFMTNIHGLFLNPFFLITGAYLGVYFLYRMLNWTFEELGRT